MELSTSGQVAAARLGETKRRIYSSNHSNTMANGYSIFVGLIVCVLLSVGVWFFAPKGENQTVWRSSGILTIAACYIMWAITFLAQLHPLIAPRRSDLRADMAH